MGVGTENVAATLEEGSTLIDQKESLNLTLPVRDEIWPSEPTQLKSACEVERKQWNLPSLICVYSLD